RNAGAGGRDALHEAFWQHFCEVLPDFAQPPPGARFHSESHARFHSPFNPPKSLDEVYETKPGRSSPAGDNVKISHPSSVTPTVCSYCAERERSRVTAVQPSDRTFTCGRPRLIIGSMVKIIPSRISTPSLALP